MFFFPFSNFFRFRLKNGVVSRTIEPIVERPRLCVFSTRQVLFVNAESYSTNCLPPFIKNKEFVIY